MKKHKSFVAILTIALSFFSCKKDNPAETNFNYFVFGRFYGMCQGEQCIEIYKLQQGQLFEDTTDQYPNFQTFYEGHYKSRSRSDFDKTKDLQNSFPLDLLSDSRIIIGQPDAGDWGGHYIEIKNSEIHRFWIIDKNKTNVESKYHQFIDLLNQKIDSLR